MRLAPAGHILGSAQVVLEWQGQRAVVSGDYKRAADPTCAPFEVVPCDVFVTEATFALPVFRHEPGDGEVARLLASHRAPARARASGRRLWARQMPARDQALPARPATTRRSTCTARSSSCASSTSASASTSATCAPSPTAEVASFAGALVLCPPSAVDDRWSRRFPDPVTAFASGWMRIKGRIRQSGVELPLVISDHADWPELLDTIVATGAEDVWVTHGRDDALVYQLGLMGRKARALALVGFEDEAE